MRALGDIEKVESQSVQIKDTYLTNFKDVNQITNQQSMLIDELKVIEIELDKYLDGQSGTNNRFLQKILGSKDYEVPAVE